MVERRHTAHGIGEESRSLEELPLEDGNISLILSVRFDPDQGKQGICRELVSAGLDQGIYTLDDLEAVVKSLKRGRFISYRGYIFDRAHRTFIPPSGNPVILPPTLAELVESLVDAHGNLVPPSVHEEMHGRILPDIDRHYLNNWYRKINRLRESTGDEYSGTPPRWKLFHTLINYGCAFEPLPEAAEKFYRPRTSRGKLD